jgi:hypothetical protein
LSEIFNWMISFIVGKHANLNGGGFGICELSGAPPSIQYDGG